MRLRDFLKDQFEPLSIANFFDPETCQQCIDLAEGGDWKQSNLGRRKIQTTQLDRVWLEELLARYCPHELHGWQYRGIHPATCQYFKYTENDTFPDHQDAAIEVSERVQSLFTLVVYLNLCKGGATGFPEKGLSISPRLGQAVLFPQNLLHNSARIEAGVKYILRAQVLYENTGQIPY